MKANNRATYNIILIGTFAVLTGCAATQTAIEHHKLESSTRLSKTIFLDPVSVNQKTIFMAVKNTSEQQLDIDRPLADALKGRGYRIVNNPAQAHYLLQANILTIGKMSKSASENALGGGYGSVLAGAGTGAAIGALSGNNKTVLAGGIIGGIVGMAADSLVKDVNYTMITDVKISERAGKGVTVHENFKAVMDNGLSSSSYQTSSRDSQFQHYFTRIVSNVDKVNLSFAQARPALEQGLVKTLSGIF
ncbi:TPA: complement resistance protein TraT [Legionella pneumophila]|nr:conjugal transfer protein TraT [Legionella pneumophila]HBD7410322.1 complement resistance protein TraT [Legionella pneumophila]HBD9405515.1 complement resistance protein TraT [Legionella pneumophila]HBI2968744.1 complement resistance protein TraT [Legionella pneumophila]